MTEQITNKYSSRVVLRTTLLLSAMVLASCGGGGSDGPSAQEAQIARFLAEDSVNRGSVRVELPDDPTYVGLLAAGGGQSVVEGIGINPFRSRALGSLSDPRRTGPSYLYGVRDNASNQFTVTNTKHTLVDADGMSSSNIYDFVIEDGSSTSLEPRLQIIAGNTDTDYAGIFDTFTIDPVSGGLQKVVFGVSTRPGDMPGVGGVTYTGTGEIQLNLIDQQLQVFQGTSSVSARFDAGEVDANVTAEDAGDIYRFTVEDMLIDGNTFSGGSMVFAMPSGTLFGITDEQAAGLFFGPISGDGPDEVGGFVAIDSAEGSATGYFVAD